MQIRMQWWRLRSICYLKHACFKNRNFSWLLCINPLTASARSYFHAIVEELATFFGMHRAIWLVDVEAVTWAKVKAAFLTVSAAAPDFVAISVHFLHFSAASKGRISRLKVVNYSKKTSLTDPRSNRFALVARIQAEIRKKRNRTALTTKTHVDLYMQPAKPLLFIPVPQAFEMRMRTVAIQASNST